MEPALDPNVSDQKERLRRLFRVKATETLMMARRGYRLDEVYMMKNDRTFQDQKLDLTDFSNPSRKFDDLLQFRQQTGLFRSRSEFSSIYSNSGNPEDRILVIYLGNEPGKQVDKKHFEIVLHFIQMQIYRHIILITEPGLNPENNNIITNRTLGYKIEVFLDFELAFDRTRHALNPISIKHIPAKQISSWAQKEEIQAEKLPMIMNTDIIAKWFGASPYDVFQTEVMSATTDTAGQYRIVRQTPVVRK